MNHEHSAQDQSFSEIAVRLAESGFLEARTEQVERELGDRLKQELLAASLRTGGTSSLPEWAAGEYGAGDLARRFVNFQKAAIRNELCDPKSGGLKPHYAKLLSPSTEKAAAVAGLAAAVKAVFDVSAPEVAAPTIAAYVALWLIHADLQHWCREKIETAEATCSPTRL